MAEEKEPQSYGSQQDWLTGKTGQEVNRQKGQPNSQRGDFNAERSDKPASSEESDKKR